MTSLARATVVVMCLALLGAGARAGQLAPLPPRYAPTPQEMAEFAKIPRAVKPLTAAESRELKLLTALPPVRDYSKYVTLIRAQSGGGCGSMSAVNILDILKEREYPYCPDFSYRFNEWNYNNKHINQLDVERDFGGAPEASDPSDYDPPFTPPGPQPSAAAYAEANAYRIAGYSDWKPANSVGDLKRMLYLHGPLFLSGDVPGCGVANSHIFTLVGYNDSKQAFTILNSWSDQWGSNGFMTMPYKNVTNPPALGTSPRVFSYRYVVDKVAPLFHQYAGRIELHHEVARNQLKVSVGVEGRTPLVVWDHPNLYAGSDGKGLTYDFPLPSYAAQSWPPSASHQWYVDVTDSSSAPAQTAGTVKMVTLVQRRQGLPPVLSRPSAQGFAIPRGGHVRIFVPSKRTATLSLQANPTHVASGGQVVLSGAFTMKIATTDRDVATVPAPGRKVTIFETRQDPIEGTLFTKAVGTVTTDQTGHYQLAQAPAAATTYKAVANEPGSTVVAATSASVTVSVP